MRSAPVDEGERLLRDVLTILSGPGPYQGAGALERLCEERILDSTNLIDAVKVHFWDKGTGCNLYLRDVRGEFPITALFKHCKSVVLAESGYPLEHILGSSMSNWTRDQMMLEMLS